MRCSGFGLVGLVASRLEEGLGLRVVEEVTGRRNWE